MRRKKPANRNIFARNDDPSLMKIIAAIVAVLALVYGGVRAVDWFNNGYVGSGVEASAIGDLDQAERLLSEGDLEKAKKLLQPILTRVNDPVIAPRAHAVRAEVAQAEGDTEAAIKHLRTAAEDYPSSPRQPAYAVQYARALESAGDTDTALAVYSRVRETAAPEYRAPALSGLARAHEEAGDLLKARELYRQAVADAQWDSDAWEEALGGLGRTNVAIAFSPMDTENSRFYHVEPGDSLTSIGTKLNTTQGLLMRANSLADPNSLSIGQTLKYTPKDFKIVIERSTCRLFLLDGDGIFKVYKVGLGKEGRTTPGRYKIGNKEKDPTWFKPGSEPIPPGDPRNELGTRWMPLIPEEENLPTDLGIHGTIRPNTIGQYASMGCPRLLNEEVEELYDLVVRSTPVAIVEEFRPQQTAAPPEASVAAEPATTPSA